MNADCPNELSSDVEPFRSVKRIVRNGLLGLVWSAGSSIFPRS